MDYIWGVAPNPTKNFLERKFLDFKELENGIISIICSRFLGVQNPFCKKGSGGVKGQSPLIPSPYESMVEMVRVVSSRTSSRTLTVSREVMMVTLFSVA